MKIIVKLFKRDVESTPFATKFSIPLMVLMVAFLFSSSEIVAQQSDRNFSPDTYENVQEAIKGESLDMRLEARYASPDGDRVAHYLVEYFNSVWYEFTHTADIEYAFIQSAQVFQGGSSSFLQSDFYGTLFSGDTQRGGSNAEPSLTLTGDGSAGLENQLSTEFIDLIEEIDLTASSYEEQMNEVFGYLQSIR